MRKKILVSLLIAVSVTCFSGCGSSSDQGSNTKEEVVTKKDADEKNEDDETFDYYELDDGTLEIEGYDNEDKAKIVEIPDTIDEKKVSVLNRYLFSNEVFSYFLIKSFYNLASFRLSKKIPINSYILLLKSIFFTGGLERILFIIFSSIVLLDVFGGRFWFSGY